MKHSTLFKKYGPWAVITGGSSGIGRAIAFELAKEKLNLILVGRGVSSLDELSNELSKRYQIQCIALMLDLAEDTGVEALQAATEGLDVGLLVASAGFGTSGAFIENPLETELEMLNVNCRSLMALSWNFGRRFVQRGSGGLILMSSIVSFQGTPWSSHYSATKAYVQVLAEGLGAELGGKNVDVLAVAPGPTKSGFASRANLRMGMSLDPERIAPVIVEALGRKATVLPGLLSKLLVYSMIPLPRRARIAIMGNVMRGMTSG